MESDRPPTPSPNKLEQTALYAEPDPFSLPSPPGPQHESISFAGPTPTRTLFTPAARAFGGSPSPSPSPAGAFNPDDFLISPDVGRPTGIILRNAATPDLKRRLFVDTPGHQTPSHPASVGFTPVTVPRPHKPIPTSIHHAPPQPELSPGRALIADLLPASIPPPPPVPPSYQKSRKVVNKCNCKNSRCLKLYCPCFAASTMCAPTCTCKNCSNTAQAPHVVSEARAAVLQRDPRAFEPKVKNLIQGTLGETHAKGCNCRKGCGKNYCVCRENGVVCGPRCTCSGPNGCLNGKERVQHEPVAVTKKVRQKVEPLPATVQVGVFSPQFPPLPPGIPTEGLELDVLEDNLLMTPMGARKGDVTEPRGMKRPFGGRDERLFKRMASATDTPEEKTLDVDFACSPTTGAKLGLGFGRVGTIENCRLPRILRVKMGSGKPLKSFKM